MRSFWPGATPGPSSRTVTSTPDGVDVELDRHLAVGRRPGQRVHEDVRQHLRRVGGQRHRNTGDVTVDHEADARALRLDRERLDHVAHDGRDLLLSLLDDDLTPDRTASDVPRGARAVLDDRERAIEVRAATRELARASLTHPSKTVSALEMS